MGTVESTPSDTVDVDKIVMDMASTDPRVVLEAVQLCNKLLMRNFLISNIMVKKGIVPICVQFLSHMDKYVSSFFIFFQFFNSEFTYVIIFVLNFRPNLQLASACVLSRIVGISEWRTKIVIDSGAVPSLIRLLESKHMNIIEQAVLTLGHIAGNGSEGIDAILDLDPIPSLVRLCNADVSVKVLYFHFPFYFVHKI